MHLDSFSTLFEIAATLNMAYIAVDYSTAFTISVAKNIFKFHDKISQGIVRCKNHIDEATINNISDVNLNGHSISHKIEKVKIDCSKLSKEIKTLKTELIRNVQEKCKLTCFSSICLHLFLYCIVACFVMGYSEQSSSIYWSFFIGLSIIYTGLMFYFGELRGKLVDFFQSVKWNSIFFVLICIIAWGLSALLHEKIKPTVDNYWEVIVPISALYPYLFFILFIFLLKKNSKIIDEDIKNKIDKVEKKCILLEGEVSKLASAHELSIEVEGLHTKSIPPQRQLKAPSKHKDKQKQKLKR